MPIRLDLLRFYNVASGWPSTRRRILERAGGVFDRRGKYLGGARCEQCGAPDRWKMWRGPAGTWLEQWPMPSLTGREGWRTAARGWFSGPPEGRLREVTVVLTVAHLNHTPGDDGDENLKALCQWCHLNWDKLHHKETRAGRKDAARPLLAEMA